MGEGRRRTREHYNHGVADCGMCHSTAYNNGCRCDACKADHNLRQKRHRLRALRDEDDYYVDPQPTRERILHLRGLGYSNNELNRFGIYRIDKILYGDGMIRRSTEKKVMEVSGRRLTDNQHVDQSAALYMVKRWHDLGVSDGEMARLSGMCRQTISGIRHGDRKRVAAKTLGRLLKAKPLIDELAIRKTKESLTHELRAELRT